MPSNSSSLCPLWVHLSLSYGTQAGDSVQKGSLGSYTQTFMCVQQVTSLARLLKQQQQQDQIAKGLPPLVLKPLFMTQQTVLALWIFTSL